MFFSVIISVYNGRSYIKNILESIVEQSMSDDIEVVISDDCSTEPCDDIIESFTNKLQIKKVSTDYNCCPGNTRQRGSEAATGEWITFADQDDTFVKDSFKLIKETINNHSEVVEIITPINACNPYKQNMIIGQHSPDSGWTHGKFFHKKRLWDKYNIKYKRDLKSHEDIYINNLINGVMMKNDEQYFTLEKPVYNWYNWKTSLSHSDIRDENGHFINYLEYHFADYLQSTGYVNIEVCDKTKLVSKDLSLACCLNTIGYSYFYIQSFICENPTAFIKSNINLARVFWKKTKDFFGITTEDIYCSFMMDDCYTYNLIKENAMTSVVPMIEPMSFREWMMLMDEKIDIPDFSYITIT